MLQFKHLILAFGAAVTYLIDGYNLMHAVGFLSSATPKRALEPVRNRFLAWLADAAQARASTLRVVFDSNKSRHRHTSLESVQNGIRVRFAYGRTADDEIEDMLRSELRATRVIVVSNDTRLHEAARRSGGDFFSCGRFVDWLIEKPLDEGTPAVAEVEKVTPEATADEMAAWLEAFTNPPRKRPPQ